MWCQQATSLVNFMLGSFRVSLLIGFGVSLVGICLPSSVLTSLCQIVILHERIVNVAKVTMSYLSFL